jgi:hypothetical protein
MTLYLERTFLRTILCTAAILSSLTLHVPAGEDDEDDNNGQATYVSNGQRITPTAAPRAVLQPLNPGLPDFPDFVSSGGVSWTRLLNEDLDDLFRSWYPKFRPQPLTQEQDRKAA